VNINNSNSFKNTYNAYYLIIYVMSRVKIIKHKQIPYKIESTYKKLSQISKKKNFKCLKKNY